MKIRIEDTVYEGTGTEIMDQLRKAAFDPTEFPDTESYIWQLRSNFIRMTDQDCILSDRGVEDMNCCFAATQAEMALPPSSPRKGSRYMAYFGGSHRAVSGLSISMRDIPTYTKKSLLLCGIMRGGS